MVHTFDKDENNAIDVDELQEILEATHKGSVKPEVTQWVMGQSDLNGNGTLSRLICKDIMVGQCRSQTRCAMVKSRYIGDDHPTFNRNLYNGYINPYYCVDDHPLRWK